MEAGVKMVKGYPHIKKLDQESIDDLIWMYEQKVPIAQIAQCLNVSEWFVKVTLQEKGVRA